MQALNPYLPIDTYIPDGEPHVFGDRVYLFGSHDKEGGDAFCMLDYEVWSAPVDDLGNWSCHGISYRAEQDPTRDERHRYMYAPDVVRGNDGRYYLYYALAGTAFTAPIHVAVADEPQGPYEYYGEIHNPDGTTFDRNITFDPGVINDNGTIRLYYGWALAAPAIAKMSKFVRKLMKPMIYIVEQKLFDKTKAQIKREKNGLEGAFTVTLAEDMLTVTSEPVKIMPGQFDAKGSGFEGHAFFEASSIRKLGDTYYFIYSSEVQHELCYATSPYPDRDFVYGGVIISNGDIGYNGRKEADRLAVTGNNHGSMECINGEWYIFYHRQTNKTSYSRQGCAEKIKILPNGHIPQVEMTSCGLNGKPLETKGSYSAVIACNLTNGNMPHTPASGCKQDMPYITCEEGERFIADIKDGTWIGYKYFSFAGKVALELVTSGDGTGIFEVYADEKMIGKIPVSSSKEWSLSRECIEASGVKALRLKYVGEGAVKLLELRFVNDMR